MTNELVVEGKASKKTRFDVEVETASGAPLIVFQGIKAQTKSEAINKAKQRLTFSADRVVK